MHLQSTMQLVRMTLIAGLVTPWPDTNLQYEQARALGCQFRLTEAAVPEMSGAKTTQPAQTQRLSSLAQTPEGLSAPDWSSIRQPYENHQYAAFPAGGGAHEAQNPGQK